MIDYYRCSDNDDEGNGSSPSLSNEKLDIRYDNISWFFFLNFHHLPLH